MSQLPASLTPFHTAHPASSAYRVTMSPHEWTWTEQEVLAMARAVVQLDLERMELRDKISKLEASINEYADLCVKCNEHYKPKNDGH